MRSLLAIFVLFSSSAFAQLDSGGILSSSGGGGLTSTAADTSYVNVTGDTMTGALVLNTGVNPDLTCDEDSCSVNDAGSVTFTWTNSGAGDLILVVDNVTVTTTLTLTGGDLTSSVADTGNAFDSFATNNFTAGTIARWGDNGTDVKLSLDFDAQLNIYDGSATPVVDGYLRGDDTADVFLFGNSGGGGLCWMNTGRTACGSTTDVAAASDIMEVSDGISPTAQTGNAMFAVGGGGIYGPAASASQGVTCTDDTLPADPGALALAPTSSIVYVTNSDADGCVITLDDANVNANRLVRIIIRSNAGGVVTFADVANEAVIGLACDTTGIALNGYLDLNMVDAADDYLLDVGCRTTP